MHKVKRLTKFLGGDIQKIEENIYLSSNTDLIGRRKSFRYTEFSRRKDFKISIQDYLKLQTKNEILYIFFYINKISKFPNLLSIPPGLYYQKLDNLKDNILLSKFRKNRGVIYFKPEVFFYMTWPNSFIETEKNKRIKLLSEIINKTNNIHTAKRAAELIKKVAL